MVTRPNKADRRMDKCSNARRNIKSGQKQANICRCFFSPTMKCTVELFFKRRRRCSKQKVDFFKYSASRPLKQQPSKIYSGLLFHSSGCIWNMARIIYWLNNAGKTGWIFISLTRVYVTMYITKPHTEWVEAMAKTMERNRSMSREEVADCERWTDIHLRFKLISVSFGHQQPPSSALVK